MFEFINNKGIAIESNNLNLLCTEKINLNRNHFVGLFENIGYFPTLVFDVAFSNQSNTPIVGISFYEGIAYAEASYINSSRQKRVRVWLLFDDFLIQQKFTGFQIENLKTNDERVDYILRFFNLNLYVYDTNPVQKSNYGLQVFDEQGKLAFSSDYTPMKMGIKGNVNDGNHIIFLDQFFDLLWYEIGHIDLKTILDNSCKPSFVTYYNGKFVEYQSYFMKFYESKLDTVSDVFEREKYHRLLRRFLYPYSSGWYFNMMSVTKRYTSIGYY